ncbi:MAG: glutamate mutase L [Chloroflexota bacterium]|nr:MAG: glutamate mutase L [Chloroflexota bacterium]
MTSSDLYAFNELEGEETPLTARSYLVVDYGHSACLVTLYDLVEGRYRLIGRGEGLNTAGPPWFDISHGLLQAIGQLSDATGRTLMSLQGQLIRPTRSDGGGVDYFGATVSYGNSLRVIVAGLLESASIASARKALQSVHANEVDCFSLADERGRTGQIESVLTNRPDVIFLVGGTDGGADKQVEDLIVTVAMALELQDEGTRPAVIYGGNAALRSLVLDSLADLTEVHLVDNVRPTFSTEQIGHAIAMLAQAYYLTKIAASDGGGILSDWCNSAPMNSAHAFGGITEYLAAVGQGRVLGLDVGASQITLVSAVQGQVDLAVRTDMGLGRPVIKLLDQQFLQAVSERPDEEDVDLDLANYILDKSSHPSILPMTRRAVKTELALAGHMIRRAAADAAAEWSWPASGSTPEVKALLLRGRVFSSAPNPTESLRAVLDALELKGVFRVLVDRYSVLPAMGLLAAEDPDMVVQILRGGALERWAWVVAPENRARSGDKILTVVMNSPSLNSIEMDIPYGDIEILPLPAGEPATLDLQPAPGVDVGAGRGKSRQLSAMGFAIGLVVDGRVGPSTR